MNIVSAEQDNLDIMLTQMGAEVKSIHGLLCFVRFNINNTELFYVYNVNAKDQFYLQKVLPYPVGAGVFSKPAEIVDYIKNDIKLFKNAVKSKSFDSFVEINMKLHHTVHKLEDTFMNYNVPLDQMLHMNDEINDIDNLLDEIQKVSEKIIIK